MKNRNDKLSGMKFHNPVTLELFVTNNKIITEINDISLFILDFLRRMNIDNRIIKLNIFPKITYVYIFKSKYNKKNETNELNGIKKFIK